MPGFAAPQRDLPGLRRAWSSTSASDFHGRSARVKITSGSWNTMATGSSDV
jgi:hypothetical protein